MQNRQAQLRANIWKINVWAALKSALILIPIYIPYLASKGLSLSQIFTLQATFALMIFVLEVPSGYLADAWGRKQTIVLGSFLTVLGAILYALGTHFWVFLLAEVVWAFGSSLISGAREALLYDTLHELRAEAGYTRIAGRIHFFRQVSEAGAAVLGGVLAGIALVLPFWATVGVMGCAFLLSLTLVEPIREKPVGAPWRQLWTVFVDTLHRHRALKWVILFAAVTGVTTRAAAWMYQPLFGIAGVPLTWYGALWAGTLVVSGMTAWLAHQVDARVGRLSGFMLILGTAVVGLLGIAFIAPAWALVAVILVQVSRGLHGPVIEDEVHGLVQSDRRATVFSISALLHNVIFVPVILALGPIAEWSVQGGFFGLSVFTIVLGVPAIVLALRHHRKYINKHASL